MSDSLCDIRWLENFPIEELPDYVFVVILSYCPVDFLLDTAPHVSRKWRELSQRPTLWKKKCIRQGVFIPPALPAKYRDYTLLCLKNVFGRNLLKNWDASGGLSEWASYDGSICVEESTPTESYGSQPLSELQLGTSKCWAISWRLVSLTQNVNLIEEGLTAEILDDLQPPIHVSVWTAARFDCALHYEINVRLYGENGHGEALQTNREFQEVRDVPQWGDNSWVKISHTFRDYGRGVRKLIFNHGGSDRQFWAGFYGPKIAAPSVTVAIEEPTQLP